MSAILRPVEPPVTEAAPTSSSLPRAIVSPVSGAGPVIVVIEDDRPTQRVLTSLLQERGYIVHSADRLQKGRELIDTYRPDLVILDGLLPDGMGTNLVGELRTHQYTGKILFMSSFYRDYKSFVQLSKTLQVDAILRKPQTANVIAACVQKLVPLSTPPHAPQGSAV